MNGRQEFLLFINPEQWKIGPLGLGRRGKKVFPTVGREAKLAAYQEALREELLSQSPQMYLPGTELKLFFAFSRTIVGRARNADATNLQKGTEDALQGVLFDNDRYVLDVQSVIFDQGTEADAWVFIRCQPTTRGAAIAACEGGFEVLRRVAEADHASRSGDDGGSNSWPPRS